MNNMLVVIDLQNDITKNYKDIICNVNKAIENARKNGFIVVYVKHNNITEGTRTFKAGTRGEAFVPELDRGICQVYRKERNKRVLRVRSGCDGLCEIDVFQYDEMRIQCSRFIRLRDELRQVENRRNVEVLRKQRVRTVVRCGFLQRIVIVMMIQIQNLF